MNKQDALKQIEEQRDMILELHGWGVFGYIKGIINQLDEPQKIELPKVDFKKSQKVKVLQFVADWYEKNKDDFETSLFQCVYELFKKRNDNELNEFENWVIDENSKPFQTLVNMHQFGYEVEKESKYIVKVKATGQCLGKYYINNEILSPRFIYTGRHADSFTRKELEEADFSWVFNCDGVGVEEVE